ncbi:5-dehydro-2-deoxygluconokinase [Halanaerobium saccharolyticum]|uniref:5-dehydro-2-deoxygluconokinase n=1 Tax=Halanaerobium saccharolyticum TaxID=43595 RepID=A0A4R7Z7M1_9FIRM|nr:sugar kinase [Halanaerobium saccharolyticum]RAK12581.1 5-dehydro-2-deoxygluconokinase [Halanaerobium saccharolyticum]TDW06507.1 5-dehydro-2-deoxygluconokinase [Halanaerobium saccharolyticum]TDX61755.1 5-dehydro-2-deoxygluconokinase [Halanaerobium saccharolyticum]
MLDVITMGETMVAITSDSMHSFKYASQFTKHIAGAESNFAIGVQRLGLKSGWISKLGKDPMGDYLEFFIRGEGVDVSQVKRDKKSNTGLMIKDIINSQTANVYYYRKNSAASKLSPEDINEEYVKQAKFIHLSGITLALSENSRKALLKMISIAKENTIKVSFDPNLRYKLWSDKAKMKKETLEIIEKSDIILPGIEEGKSLLNISPPEEIIKEFYKIMKGLVVLKLGKEGALYYQGDEIVHIPAYKVENVIDPVGAGDAFAAGLISGLIKNMTIKEAVKLANLVGAFCVTVKGDIEGLPTWEQIEISQGRREEFQR